MASPEFTTEELTNEIWKPVVGFEGFYSVSNLGRIMRLAGTANTLENRIVKPWIQSRSKYAAVTLSTKNRRSTANIHRLVTTAFLGPRPKGLTVNHIDGIKSNARLANLEYISQHANAMHPSAMGLLPCGERNNKAKLTEIGIREIRASHARGTTAHHLASQYGVTVENIRHIVSRHTWKHI